MDLRIFTMLAIAAAAILAAAGTTIGTYTYGEGAGNFTQPEENVSDGVTYYYAMVTMSSFASENVKPDKASFTVTIKTLDGNSRAESSRKNAEVAIRIKDALAANGLDKSDMETQYYYVNEKYEDTYDWYGDFNGSRLVGYETTHVIRVETDKPDILGEYFDAVLENGASDVGDVRWSLKDETVLELQKKLSKEAFGNLNEKVVYAFPDAEAYELNSLNESLGFGSWNDYPGYTNGASWYGFTEGEEMTEVEIPDIEIKVNIVATYIVQDFDAGGSW